MLKVAITLRHGGFNHIALDTGNEPQLVALIETASFRYLSTKQAFLRNGAPQEVSLDQLYVDPVQNPEILTLYLPPGRYTLFYDAWDRDALVRIKDITVSGTPP